jgi:hypothetical protein
VTGTLTDALLAVHQVLEDARVPHALCGGLAANLYREEVRATSDVDLAIAAGPADLVGLVRDLESAGWRVAPSARAGEQLRLSRRDLARVDCLVATTDFERAAIDHSVPFVLEGVGLRVLTAEDLIVFKLLAGRARDEAVAAVINGIGRSLDDDYIKGWLDQFGDAQAWDRAVEEARREAG